MRNPALFAALGLILGAVSVAQAADPAGPAAHAEPAPPAVAAPKTEAAAPSAAAAPKAEDSFSPATPPAATPSAPAAPGSAPPPAAAAESSEVKHLMAMGYRPEKVNGKVLYCRREAELGSRFERKVCTTPEDNALRRQSSKDALQSTQRNELNIKGN